MAIGVGASEVELDGLTVLTATLGILVVAVLWSMNLDHSPERIERHLRALRGRDRNTTARDAYSFLHLPMVEGIVSPSA